MDPDLAWEVDWTAFRNGFLRAGFGRVEVEVLPDAPAVLRTPCLTAGRRREVGLVLGQSAREADGVVAVDPEAVARLLWRHREALEPVADASVLRRNIYTAVVIRRVWAMLCGPGDPPAGPSPGEVLELAAGSVLLTDSQEARLRRCLEAR